MSKAINVKSEVGRLDKVLLHRPGSELERITPDNREDMLVEDVLFLTNARKEHDAFAKTLQERGIEVVYLAELTASALATSDDAKFGFIDDLINQSGVFEGKYRGELVEHMHNLACGEVIDIAMAGLTVEEFGFGAGGLSRHMGRGESPFIIHPMPNLYFTRDPFCSIGNGVAISHMWSQVRNRETIFGKYIFAHHPDFVGQVDFNYYERHWSSYIEGGDILNLSPKVLAIGISQRTSADAIELLAKKIFSDANAEIRHILVFEIPKQRKCMHLDTVFTMIDKNKFLLYENIMENLRHAWVLGKKSNHGDFEVQDLTGKPLKKILEDYLGLDEAIIIRCGGNNPIAADREQWNDAANTLALAPGVVVTYDRNPVTNALLRESLGDDNVLEIASGELSRGRGGPRCMSMPLIRR